jgi:prophage maintenance system killer protein
LQQQSDRFLEPSKPSMNTTKNKKLIYPTINWVTDTIIEASELKKSEGLYFLEDIPSLGKENINSVENIFDQIQQFSHGVELYPTLESKTAWIFYCFCKNHPLENGNKRMAVLITVYFLFVNVENFELDIIKFANIMSGELPLTDIAIDTVQSDPNKFKETHQELTTMLKKIIDLLESQK